MANSTLSPGTALRADTNLEHPTKHNDNGTTKHFFTSTPLRPYSTVPDRMPHDAELPCGHRGGNNLPPHPDHLPQHAHPQQGLISSIYHMRQKGTRMAPFAGRLGGNQTYVVDRSNPENAELLKKVPDAAPNLNAKEAFDLRGFSDWDLYRAAVIEGMGTLVLVFQSGYVGLSPNTPPPAPSATTGAFATSSFLGPLIGAILNVIVLTLLIYSFGAISGAHMNPLITFGTFCARLTTFPRMVLYIAAQLAGASLGGLLLRAAADTREFKVGGCFLFTDMGASVASAFTVEFVGSLLLLFLAFGVGLDPRQAELFGPALGPVLVGLAAGSLLLSFSFSKPGYGGASMNPARCFGVFVGSRFPSWAWVTWVGPIAASVFHGVVYFLVPPVAPKGRVFRQKNEAEESEKVPRVGGVDV
ncbi:uncharacterized protein A1O9_04264 [Exophiala aquamarina CBS 119918]|uniref:Aquaporin rerated protein, other eukaryote n=1 Tax=Exophiala aquamarina CBS 119918 TaxID=1182545 RepID=A0A072PV40_9EURO|nr:uncharacterized protein A1O9_04264 [Exophiala aquamarina CBS 119918]KEF59420.1 hypothetical protein A1O9_04264 [Exophiala aquamarina CBS 119918]